jgi:hypothetical protein
MPTAANACRLLRDTHSDDVWSVAFSHDDLVQKGHLFCVEGLALPGEIVDELGDLGRERGAKRNNCRPFPSPFGMVPASAADKRSASSILVI